MSLLDFRSEYQNQFGIVLSEIEYFSKVNILDMYYEPMKYGHIAFETVFLGEYTSSLQNSGKSFECVCFKCVVPE